MQKQNYVITFCFGECNCNWDNPSTVKMTISFFTVCPCLPTGQGPAFSSYNLHAPYWWVNPILLCVSLVVHRQPSAMCFFIMYQLIAICTQEPLQVTVGITMSPKNGVFLRIVSHDLQKWQHSLWLLGNRIDLAVVEFHYFWHLDPLCVLSNVKILARQLRIMEFGTSVYAVCIINGSTVLDV